jgi:small subunit ribosomal protein S15
VLKIVFSISHLVFSFAMNSVLKSTNVSIMSKNSDIITSLGVSVKDTGNPALQIVLLTFKISYLSAHCKKHAKDHSTKRGLLQAVSKRKALVAYLQKNNPSLLSKILIKLDIRNTALS